MYDLTAPHIIDAEATRRHIEASRWPEGVVSPRCGGVERIYAIKSRAERNIRNGMYKCGDCKKQFTVTVGTVFETSRNPLKKWLMAIQLMVSNKKGISAKQLERMLCVTYKMSVMEICEFRYL